MNCSDGVNWVIGKFILNINDIPQVANVIPDQTLIVGTAMNFTLPANVFSDFSNLTITSSATPAGITYDPVTRSFSGTPTAAGTTLITLTGTDGNGASNTTTFNFIVRNNQAPVFTVSPIPDQMFNIDQTVAFLIAVSDPDGDTTTTTAIDPPAFMTFTAPAFTNGSGLIVANAGTHSIAMKVCD